METLALSDESGGINVTPLSKIGVQLVWWSLCVTMLAWMHNGPTFCNFCNKVMSEKIPFTGGIAVLEALSSLDPKIIYVPGYSNSALIQLWQLYNIIYEVSRLINSF